MLRISVFPRHMPAGASVPSCQIFQRERLDKEQSASLGAESAKGGSSPPAPARHQITAAIWLDYEWLHGLYNCCTSALSLSNCMLLCSLSNSQDNAGMYWCCIPICSYARCFWKKDWWTSGRFFMLFNLSHFFPYPALLLYTFRSKTRTFYVKH